MADVVKLEVDASFAPVVAKMARAGIPVVAHIGSRPQHAKQVGAKVIGVVGRDGGYTAQVADACVIVPTVNPAHTTPHAEAFQAVIWHLLVSHPDLKTGQTKWESVR